MANIEDLKEYAKAVAEEFNKTVVTTKAKYKLPRLTEVNKTLVKAYKLTNEEVKSKGSIIAAAEWLLDNFYVIEEQVKELESCISKGLNRIMPVLGNGEYKGYPRIYGLAMRLVAYTDARIDESVILDFINEFQKVTYLSSVELWALPLMLRMALIQKVRDIALFIIDSIGDRKSADMWAQRLLDGLAEYKGEVRSREALKTVIAEHDAVIGFMTPVYAERLLQRLREEGAEAASIIRWVDGRLAVQHTSADEIIQAAHQQQAVNQVSMGNAVMSLRQIPSMKWEDIFEELSMLEKVLRQDPAGVYPLMDFQSRDYYRHHIELTARRYKLDEVFVAQKAVECALEHQNVSDERYRHIGFYIIDKGRKNLESKLGRRRKINLELFVKEHPSVCYFSSIGILVAGLMCFFLSILRFEPGPGRFLCGALSALAALVPIVSVSVGIIHFVAVHICKPSLLPKYELKDGIPPELRTMVVIPTLLTSERRVIELIEQMEVFYLANQEENLHFALVGDFKDGSQEVSENDSIITETATRLINELNNRYSQDRQDIFFFFHRHRQWNEAQRSWMGWERKRGALTELNAMLLGRQDTSYSVKVGDLSVLDKIVYIITLDADTQLPRDAARKLIGAIAHPLNAPVLNEEGTKVIEGYGILQPRIGVSVDSASRSFFSLTFSGQTGVDPYTTAVSDVYQDLFGEGIFTGKGIYHLRVFNKVLENTIPDNSILSHDLLEGSYARAGLVTDIELIDGYPASYMAYSMRLHRWVRGDWQLLPWLGSYVRNRAGERVKNHINMLSKWKMVDNLRRSLISPALFLMLLLGPAVMPEPAWAWIALAFITLILPLTIDLTGTLFVRRREIRNPVRLSDIFCNTGSLFWQAVLSFVFLGHQAWLMADAIMRTLWRLFISHRNMLEWVTAADAESKFKGTLSDYWRKMGRSVATTIILFAVAVFIKPRIWPAALIMAAVWSASPVVAYKVSKPKARRVPRLMDEQILKLRVIARKTWRYFDELVNEQSNWLPPDNYQVEPPTGIAHRTSPTNMGIHLMSILVARDLGYLTTLEAIKRISKTVGTMQRLEKWKAGHFYNWYNILTLEPLKPLYVSTVDNGNLVSYLITINQGIKELLKRPLIGKECVLGLRDALISDCEKDLEHQSLLNMMLTADNISVVEWQMLLDDLKGQCKELDELIIMHEEEIGLFIPWVKLLQKIPSMLLNEKGVYREASQKFKQLLEKLNENIELQNLLENYLEILKSLSETMASLRRDAYKSPGYQDARSWLKQLELSLANSYTNIKSFVSDCTELLKTIDAMIKDTDFSLLYDEKRELFTIGFNVEEGQATKSYYDLLASEARQASFIAIAKGDVPQKHWFKLGRSLTLAGNLRVLISWSGTMFEYLMPLLIMRNYDNTLLDETYSAVVQVQKQYTDQRHIPWGISESGFYAFDLHLNYQYKAFGVPQLGLKRGLINDLVIAPYATMLALPIEPDFAYKNIEVLCSEGMLGRFGLYEAIDYTPERLPKKKKSIVVKSFMAHHQGMSLIAIDNFLNKNIMQNRFHSAPMVKATELLLQERMPRSDVYIKEYEESEIMDLEQNRRDQEIRARRVFTDPNTPTPEVNILSNGNYAVMSTNSGGGYSQYGGQAVSRWRADATRDNWGMMFFIKNLNSENYWSAAYNPVGVMPEDYKVIFETEKTIYKRKDGNIETITEIVVSPEFDGEVRRLTLVNHSESSRVLEVTSYFEVVLTSACADMAHPAFSNLFIQTEYLTEYDALLATRRPRIRTDKNLWLLHTAIVEGEQIGRTQYETDRSRFIGRGRNISNPQVMDPEFPLSNTTGAVLDPIMSIRKRIRLQPGGTARISYITAVADTREGVVALARECMNTSVSDRSFELAWTHSQVELRYLNMTASQANIYQTIAAQILYQAAPNSWKQEVIAENKRGITALWSYGISGDLPIVVVRVSKLEHTELAKQMLTAHEYLRLKGLSFDLVLLNEYGNSYEQPLQEKLNEIVAISHARNLLDKMGGVFLLQSSNIPQEDIKLLLAAAKLNISGDGGTLISQLEVKEARRPIERIKGRDADYRLLEDVKLEVPSDLLFFNGIGGYSRDNREYVICINGATTTPLPWSNIVANPDFGFLITESGASYTWCKNSRENKLTPWSNDPVVDPSGEILYIRDETTGEFWTATPHPIKQNEKYIIRHGHGYSRFEHISHGLVHNMLVFVPVTDPVKIISLKLKNITDQDRTLTLTYYAEWVLGVNRERNMHFTVTAYDQAINGLLAYNRYNETFADRLAFLACNAGLESYTGDRNEFLGRNGTTADPEAMHYVTMSGRVGAGYDPCGAIRSKISIKPGEEREVVILLGQGDSLDHVMKLVSLYSDSTNSHRAYEAAVEFWESKLNTIIVDTPDDSMNLLLNRWLIYQSYACRIMARTAFYQAGGAFGFRDQLQDVMAVVYCDPAVTRKQIMLSAEHQFTEGDVQHWWHPERHGVRTRITDDLLFLPYVTADYIAITGDLSILDEQVSFLEDEPLKPDEHERYNIPKVSVEKADLYDHCIRAIEKALCFGSHNLPLIGGGDWNDGMDKVGIEGRGESVWLAWFLITTLKNFIPVCRIRGDNERAAKYESIIKTLTEAIEANAWDGGWYRRAYFDDGTPLGSEKNEECQIDSISQSWSIISGAAREQRVKSAMEALKHHLIDEENGLIKLLSPPFEKSAVEPGYIKGYVPGVRENGGQYTHAAAWTILAFALMGDGNMAWKLYNMINPINHTKTQLGVFKYKAEPYVIAADVYAVHPHKGRGGWTWYTGSASWMYRVGIESILGLKARGSSFTMDPCIPDDWTEYKLRYKYHSTTYNIKVDNSSMVCRGVSAILMDGKEVEDKQIPLVDDGLEHNITVIMGTGS